MSDFVGLVPVGSDRVAPGVVGYCSLLCFLNDTESVESSTRERGKLRVRRRVLGAQSMRILSVV